MEAMSNNEIDDKMNEIQNKDDKAIAWDDIIGLDKEKKVIQEAIDDLMINDKSCRVHYNRIHSILLYGPSGCEKSFIFQAIKNSPEVNIYSAEQKSKWFGESDNHQYIYSLARKHQPSIIIFD